MQLLKCLFGKHEFYNTGETARAHSYGSDEISGCDIVELLKCKHCPAKKAGKTTES